MKKFTLSILIFFGPLIFLAFFLEQSLRQIPNDYLFKKEYLDANSNKIKTLVLGSSHSFYGIDPSYFSSKTFNGSYVSQSLDYDYKILKLYENKLDSLKTLVLPISYFSMYFNLDNGDESWRIKNYNIYYGMKSSYSLRGNTEIFENNPSNSMKRLKAYYLNKSYHLTSSDLGWGTGFNSEKSKDLTRTGKKSALEHTQKYKHSEENTIIFRKNEEILTSIIKWSKNKDVKVILFTPPAYYTYRRNINKEQLDITTKKAFDVASKYDNCTYYNFFDDSSFTKVDYFDADHLNEIGAKKLSLKIDNLICNAK